MVKTILFIGASAFAGSIIAQPNGSALSNNLSNVYINVNVNNNSYSNINVQQMIQVNKPKPVVIQQRRATQIAAKPKPVNIQSARRNNAIAAKPKPVNSNPQTARRPVRARRPVPQTNISSNNLAINAVNFVNNIQVQAPIVQVSNVDNANESINIKVPEFVPQEQQQMQDNNFNPVESNEQKPITKENTEQKESFSISLPKFNKPQFHFSYSGTSSHHKSISIKKSFTKTWLKISRKHKTKRGGKLRKYITNNCCGWN